MLITVERLVDAERQAREKIRRAGLYLPAMSRVRVQRTYVPNILTHAYYWYGYSRIDVPVFSLANLGELWWPLPSILIHEFGHAVDDLLLFSEGWERVDNPFGSWTAAADYSRRAHVSPYAATSGCEDFAECYRYLVEARGRISKKLPQLIRKKLKFVRKVVTCCLRGKKFPSS